MKRDFETNTPQGFGDPEADPQKRGDQLQSVLDHLEALTARLRNASRMVAAMTALSVISTLGVGALGHVSILVHNMALVFAVTFPLFSITLVVGFDSMRRRGDVIFKELSDELQWYVRFGPESQSSASTHGDAEPVSLRRPDIRTRIVLREYASATTLPLLSSPASGPGIYASVNVALAIASVLLSQGFIISSR